MGGGEQFTAGGQVMSMTLAQALAPYDPQKLWDSYNPGVTVSVSKRLARSVSAQASYNLEREGGAYGAPFAGSPMAVAPRRPSPKRPRSVSVAASRALAVTTRPLLALGRHKAD